MSGLSLYVIEEALAELLSAREDLLTETPGIRPEPERAAELTEVEKALAEYVAREVGKVDGIHGYLRAAEATEEAARAEAARFTARANSIKANVERVKRLVLDVMVMQGKKRIEGTAGRAITRQANGGVLPLVISDETAIPSDCKRATVQMPADEWESFREHMLDIGMTLISERVEPDQKAIREAIVDTGGVPGASLGERSEHIRIKP